MFTIVDANYEDPAHARAVVNLLDGYARDMMGGGAPLSEDVRRRLVPELAARPAVLALLAFAGAEAAGLLIAHEGFSTFAARPLLNVHDLSVAPAFRGQGVGRALLREAESRALARGCCKLTLEVLEGKTVARRLYESVGFHSYELDPRAGRALFLEKKLAR